ncbi:uncharacterized protein L3040_007036 [Drepanopeziza brunnea f. sp. 'multigermtubi']|uniref:Putative short-chain dehydrogenase/reductase family oxidoreductase n=1 Tax=Marssonina brunnea f. sp. multigermtubi (strain MB_m1) TaxID=1072389 RepID=K1W749_MARBU|nr:putative short-chain dehydrogenase/reductase family oxidoreductase [Drepanopeziza brunnea f. sp. 'multigermtubi' MB_m1]EKD12880.1 putative short-chain dehydrogenase/reductase family oxidoreductase [Drepanopeziza brunnea f. sp. 'multigermtubi' MB_m1]KAJ5038168.1 hypothetical protein L3040_007036 [Drepanopeziza brunnea f. sp. 'multigermtubi']
MAAAPAATALEYPYATVLVLGATSGIGLALAEKLVTNGSHVIAVGRREEKLASFQEKHGRDKVSIIKFDITDLEGIPGFVENVTKAHPTLSSVIVNSGIQRRLDFTAPSSIDLSAVSAELTTNYLAPIHLTTAFLPHLTSLSRQTRTSIVFTTSGLALVPITRCPNYCATKAALHHAVLCLREQLRHTAENLTVVEVMPPAVQTELHDAKHQPDIKEGGKIGMPLEKFTEECWTGLCEGKEEVPVEMAMFWYEGFEKERQKMFKSLVEKGVGVL